jgi:hypothetical protein
MSYEQRMSTGSSSMFPSTMFPSFGPTQPQIMQPMPEGQRKEARPHSEDELFEIVALVAILKLLSR